MKLDLKDKKILYELDKNCRISNHQIAKKIKISPEAVSYRIRKLEKEKIITQYQLITNLSKLGIIQFKICLSLKNLKKESTEKIIDKLKKNSHTKWIVSTRGNWDLVISLEATSLEEVDSLKENILELFKNFILKKELSILIEAETYSRNYLSSGRESANTKTIMNPSSPSKISDMDLKLLKELSINARTSLVDLSEKLKTTPRIVNYKIKKLEKEKIILGYKIAINYRKLGIKFYKLFIYLDKVIPETNKELIDFFRQQKNIIHYVKVLGNWDFEPEIEVYSEEEFDKILENIKEKFSEIIQRIEILTIKEEHKFVYF